MTALPFFIFWAIVLLARKELGWRGALTAVGIWTALLAGCLFTNLSPYIFVAAQSLLDAVLILVIFKRDIRIR